MSQLIAALLMAVLPLALHAQGDPLASPECQAARAGLEQALKDADKGAAPAGEPLVGARARARNACLGRSEGARQRSGAPEPAQRVAPPMIENGRAQLPKLEGAPPPVVIPRPTIITACDASGCWDSEGRRLNNAGPALMGPRGLCSGTGAIISCP